MSRIRTVLTNVFCVIVALLTFAAQIFEEADVSGTGSLSYSEYMTAVVNHPILVQFITGGGSVRA